ncbi:hypothetical protein GDO86_015685 [Hymenochirus boettgeri]|uniref:C2H2-type domain-containing protein n=1 Tax=Hymenochirus boettgeri TaxID=247094 RepID=A0A8T2JZW5_9PIPI|nr:hypothetical protein GDO86_015685 [Hymenochirus boettgeri]
MVKVADRMACTNTSSESNIGKRNSAFNNSQKYNEHEKHAMISKKVLELANKMIQQITKQIPIKYDNIAVYFSMEEWEYLRVHKEQYKHIATKDFEDNSPLGEINGGENAKYEGEAKEICKRKNNKWCSKEKPYECELCKKQFSSNSVLARHFNLHTGKKSFSCNICGKTFACRSHFSDHKRIHTGERPYTCLECGRKFTNSSHLTEHRVVHTGEKPFTCPKCGKGFTRNSSLTKHSGIHADQKPYVCQDCGKSYCQYANLVVHLRLHTGEKPYVCNHCDKGFICKATLVRHQRTHTGERPYSCSQCAKRFRDQSSLAKHKHIHSKEPKSTRFLDIQNESKCPK